MPTIQQNSNLWNENYDWSHGGDEWSESWGGPEAQWFGAIYPRIQGFLPTGTILEIAPGFGRWTQFLKDSCERLMVVDLSERCIDSCKSRFAQTQHLEYYVNDGKSLEFIPDQSIDFAFSFDSLVHAEADVIEAYLHQLARKLKPNGIGFIHHSNIGAYTDPATGELRSGLLNPHWRAKSMSARAFEKYCEAANLQCTNQEIINWGTEELSDAFSVFTRKESVSSRANRVLENPDFMTEAHLIRKLSPLYSVRLWRGR